MKNGILVDLDWAYIGAVLADKSADEQAAFFRGFLRECNSWGTHYQVEKQLAAVNGMLTKEEREQLGMLSYEEGEQ